MPNVIDTAYVKVLPDVAQLAPQIKSSVNRALAGVSEGANKSIRSVDDVAKRTTTNVGGHFTRMGNIITTSMSGISRTVTAPLAAATTVAKYGALALGGVAVAGGLMAGSAIKAGLQTAAAMEQAQISFSTLLGSGQKAQVFLADLADFAAKTPYELPGLIDASRQLIGAGLNAKQTKQALVDYGDATSALGIGQDGFNRIMLATSQALASGTLHAGDLLQMTEAGLPVWKLLSEALHKPVSEVRKLSENGQLLTADVLPKLEAQMHHDYGGAMSKQSQTLAGLWSTLMDTFHQGMAKAILPLEPVLRNVIPKAADFLGKALSGLGDGFAAFIAWTKAHWPEISQVFQVVGRVVMNIIHDMGAVFSFLRENVFMPIISWVMAHWPTIQAVIETVAHAINVALNAVVTWVVANWPRIGQIVDFVAGIFRAVVAWIVANWPQISATFQRVWSFIQPVLMNLWGLLQAIWNSILKPLVAWVQANWPTISTVFRIAFIAIGLILATFMIALRLVAATLTWLVNTIIGPLMRLWLLMITAAINSAIAIMRFLVTVAQTVAGAIVAAWNFLWRNSVSIFNAIKNAVLTAWNALTGGIKAAWNTVSSFLVNAWQKLVGTAASWWGKITGAISTAWNGVVAAVQGVWNRVVGVFVTGVNWVIDHIINPFIGLLNGALGWLGVHISKVGDIGNPGAPSGGGGTPGPAAAHGGGFAKGGVVPGYAPGQDRVHAMLSPGEGVLVPETVRGLGGAAGISALNEMFTGRTRGRYATPGSYQFGGIIHAVGSVLSNAAGGIVHVIRDVTADIALGALHVAEAPIKALLHFAPPFARDIGEGLFKFINDKIEAFIRGHAKKPEAAGGGTSIPGNTSGTQLDWVFAAEKATGTPASWTAAILRRIMFESGGNPNAQNNWDSNAQAGDPSRGLMQTIMSTFTAYHQAGTSWNIFDPVANIAAAINYIKARYGSIFAIDPPVQGYATGGPVNRTGLAYLHRGEEVLANGAAQKYRNGEPAPIVELGPGTIRALAQAMAQLVVQMDGREVATLVTKYQGLQERKGVRR